MWLCSSVFVYVCLHVFACVCVCKYTDDHVVVNVYTLVCVCVFVNACVCGSVFCSTISTQGYLGLMFSELQNKSCIAPGSIPAAVYHLPYLHTVNRPQAGIGNRCSLHPRL